MPGPRRDFGPKQKVENPVKVFKRIMSYVLKRYPVHCLFVLIRETENKFICLSQLAGMGYFLWSGIFITPAQVFFNST